MREIKFRAWYQENKKMYELAEVNLWGDPDQATCELAADDEELFDIYLHEVVLMQYAGLKDKYGREICEGDIIERSPYGMPTVKYTSSVLYHDTHCCFVSVDLDGRVKTFLHEFTHTHEIEVIGNIYDNPELLKEVIE